MAPYRPSQRVCERCRRRIVRTRSAWCRPCLWRGGTRAIPTRTFACAACGAEFVASRRRAIPTNGPTRRTYCSKACLASGHGDRLAARFRLRVTAAERKELWRRVSSARSPSHVSRRAAIILGFVGGLGSKRIAKLVGVAPSIATRWRQRFRARGLAGLEGKPRRLEEAG